MLLRSPQENQRGRCKMAKCWLLPNPKQNSHWFQCTQLFILSSQGWHYWTSCLKLPWATIAQLITLKSAVNHTVIPSSPCPGATGQQVSHIPHSSQPQACIFIYKDTSSAVVCMTKIPAHRGWTVTETSLRKLSSSALNLSGSKESIHALRSSFSG